MIGVGISSQIIYFDLCALAIQAIIKNTVRMLKEIDKKIVVEGVETKESLKTFRCA